MRYNRATPNSPRAGGGERTIPHAGAISIRNASNRCATRDGGVATLEGISLGICEGDFVAVAGPSGGGKTRRLDIRAGLMLPSARNARLRGTRITGPRQGFGVARASRAGG